MTWVSLALVMVLGAGRAHASDLPPGVAIEIRAAAMAGLPSETLEAKAREGLAKGVDPARLAAVISGYREDLAHARALLPDVTADDLAAAAAALRSGASGAAIGRVGSLPAEVRNAALLGVADLLHAGLTEDVAIDLLEASTRTRDPNVIRQATLAATCDLTAGRSPTDLDARALRAIEFGNSPLSALPSGAGTPPGHGGDLPGQGHGPPDDPGSQGNGPPDDPGNGNGNGPK